jgi:hypothetical protein
MLFLANLVYRMAAGVSDLETFRDQINENFSAERFSFYIYRDNGALKLTLNELYGGRVLTAED